MYCWDTNVICLSVLFKHGCCLFIHVVYTWKLCTRLLCLNNAQHLCLHYTNIRNNIFPTNLERTHKACKFVMPSKKSCLGIFWMNFFFLFFFSLYIYIYIYNFLTFIFSIFVIIILICFYFLFFNYIYIYSTFCSTFCWSLRKNQW